MNKRTVWILMAVLGVALLVGGVWLYDWVLGDTLDASQPISAVPLPDELGGTQAVEAQEAIEASEPGITIETVETNEPVGESEAGATHAQEEVAAASATKFMISQDESHARFTIFEELNGQPTDVVGVTRQAAAEIEVNWEDLSQTRIGVITINARTLVTDQDRRNQAIRNRILNTDQFEFVTFTPTGISGLSGSAEPGQTFNFQISGDLTIRDITKPLVFETSVTVKSKERLSGLASTTILRSDYGLMIPNVPFVANVGENVALELEFVLVPAS